jgi:non-homologous end joining protein Ku
LKGHFRAEEYANAHREALEATIRKKAGATVGKRGKGAAAADRKVIDLMERLRQSLEGGKGKASAKAAKAVAEEPAHAERHYHRKKAG